MRTGRLIGSAIPLILAVSANAALAQQGSRRDDLAQTYLDDSASQHSIYASTPIDHIAPKFNTITYALGGDLRNVTVLPSADDKARNNFSDQLQLTGYTVSPYLAVSLKRIGLGFAAEQGMRTARYSLLPNDGGANASYAAQESQMTFTSVGAFLYLIPFTDLPPWLTVDVLAGGRSYNAKHRVSPDEPDDRPVAIVPSEAQTFTYNVNRYTGGADVGVHPLKTFTIIGWTDYTITDAAAANSQYAKATTGPGGQPASPGSAPYNFKDDIQLFWFDQPRLRYGIDIAVEISDLSISFGDALGTVSAFNSHSDQIKNQTLSISLALKQKAN